MKNILVADDHPMVLEGIKCFLAEHGLNTISCLNQAQVDDTLRKNIIDLAIVDLQFEELGDGLRIIETIHQIDPAVPILIYTMHNENWNLSLLSGAEARSIVFKDESPEILTAIQKMLRGEQYTSPGYNALIQQCTENTSRLKPREIEILQNIADGKTTREISVKMGVTPKTIEYYRSNILHFMNSRNIFQAVCKAAKSGIISILSISMYTTVFATDPYPIDMGGSVLWADRNLGAESPADAGHFIAFGETFPKDTYNWATYTLCNDGDMFDCIDPKVEQFCQNRYDVAHVTLGDGWRLPTLTEIDELLQGCASSFVDNAYTFTAPNGNTITLPVCGYMNGSTLRMQGIEAVYTSSEFEIEEETEDGKAYRIISPVALMMTPSALLPRMSSSAHLGVSIRPVKSKYAGVTDITADDGSMVRYIDVYGRVATHATRGIVIRLSGNIVTKTMR